MARSPKRFIAAAVCPDCGARDSIRVWQEDGIWQRECVHCGHYSRLDETLPPTTEHALAQPVKLMA